MDYTSKRSISKFIEIIADSVRSVICKQIKDSGRGLFSALIDESKDTAKCEELAIAVRYSVGNIVERFFDLKPLEDFGAQSIMTFTKEVIDLIIKDSGAALISLGAYLAELYFLLKELQTESINWMQLLMISF